MADEIAIMYAGKIAERGPADGVFSEPAHPYTQGLLQSVPRLRSAVKIQSIPGQPPDLVNPPSGCKFHPRCRLAIDVCRRKEPVETKLSNEHYVSCWLYPSR